MVAKKRYTPEEWHQIYNTTMRNQINEEFAKVSEAIMKQQEPKPDPKVVWDKLATITEEAKGLKFVAGSSKGDKDLVGVIDVDGIWMSRSGSYRDECVRIHKDQVLPLRDWLTTLLGEDKIVYRQQVIVPYGSDVTDVLSLANGDTGHPVRSKSEPTQSIEVLTYMLLGGTVGGILWAVVHFWL